MPRVDRHAEAPAGPARIRARVQGTVHGVGFHPHVYRLARGLGLGGHLLDEQHGVLVEVEGSAAAIERFLESLVANCPPFATIERVLSERIDPLGSSAFELLAGGEEETPASALVSPDAASCEECLAELFDPADPRHRYPFTSCANCGPRFTIATGVPYDRALTTMGDFEMCERCLAEYVDPLNRRFHAHAIACPSCGPQVRLVDADGAAWEGEGGRDPVGLAAGLLVGGGILAVKGAGGFQLVCRADHEAAVIGLRSRKRREERPFAVIAPSLAAARELVELGSEAEALLAGRARPIVIARRHPGATVADALAPGSRDLRVGLAATPLHHLLLADLRALAVAGTCLAVIGGEQSDGPAAHEDEDALVRLRGVADAFLLHDRPIHIHTEDSVVRDTAIGPLTVRRSRGHVPTPLALPVAVSCPILACGAERENTFCLAEGERAWVSHHIGDLRGRRTVRSYCEGVEHLQRLLSIAPGVIAHELGPDHVTRRFAIEREQALIGVQHHHAHFAACLAEHGETGPAIGVIFDRGGHGSDGTVWGGELLVGGLRHFERVGRLSPVRVPGGERAEREPWRSACGWVAPARTRERAGSSLRGDESERSERLEQGEGRAPQSIEELGLPSLPDALVGQVRWELWAATAERVKEGIDPLTSSVGYLLDAVAALCGLRALTTYEGQAAYELEHAVDHRERGAYPIALTVEAGEDGELLELDPRAAIGSVMHERAAGVQIGVIAARFHRGLALATTEACARVARVHELETVVLSGDAFLNRVLLEQTVAALQGEGLRVLIPRRLPLGDGAISYGQAAVAAAVKA